LDEYYGDYKEKEGDREVESRLEKCENKK